MAKTKNKKNNSKESIVDKNLDETDLYTFASNVAEFLWPFVKASQRILCASTTVFYVLFMVFAQSNYNPVMQDAS